MSKLQTKAVIVKYKISCYGGEKSDKTESNNLAAFHNIEDVNNAGVRVVNKVLGRSHYLDACKKYAAYIRSQIQNLGIIPYTKGSVIVSFNKLPEFKSKCISMAQQYQAKVQDLVDNFDDIVENARRQKGSLLKEADIPSVDYVKSRFGFKMTVTPFPKASNFEDLLDSEEEVAELKKELQEDLNNISSELNKHLLYTLEERLEAIKNNVKSCKVKLKTQCVEASIKKAKYVKDRNILDHSRVNYIADKIIEIVNRPPESFANDTVKETTIQEIDNLLGN